MQDIAGPSVADILAGVAPDESLLSKGRIEDEPSEVRPSEADLRWYVVGYWRLQEFILGRNDLLSRFGLGTSGTEGAQGDAKEGDELMKRAWEHMRRMSAFVW